jgi:ribosomal protein S18 acetylase RimI-like enzyme
MDGVIYRDAALSDAEELARVARDTFIATFGALYRAEDLAAFLAETRSPEAVARYLAESDTRHCLALRDGTIVGFADLGPFKLPYDPGQRRAVELHRLYVVEAAQGKGIADRLMAWILDQAQDLGAEDLYLGVYQDNQRAVRFYMRHGFEIVGEYLFEVGAHRDQEYVMRRRV